MLHYLSVHDFVWINSTITGKTVPFDYEKLEASMAAQYGFLKSDDALPQAANLMETLLLKRPFQYGNVRAAFIATLVFLTANGFTLQVDDEEAAGQFEKATARAITASDAIKALFKRSDLELKEGVTLRALVTHICNEHVEALRQLTNGDE